MIKQLTHTLVPFFKSKGYSCLNKCFFKIDNDFSYCVEFDMPGNLLYVTYYILPLYIPSDNRYYTYGHRLNVNTYTTNIAFIKETSNDGISAWNNAFIFNFEQVILPFFNSIATVDELLRKLQDRSVCANTFMCPEVDLCRLEFFTMAYTNCGGPNLPTDKYRKALRECAHLSDKVLEKYSQEIDQVLMAVSNDNNAFFEGIKDRTVEMCFKTTGKTRG